MITEKGVFEQRDTESNPKMKMDNCKYFRIFENMVNVGIELLGVSLQIFYLGIWLGFIYVFIFSKLP